MSPVLDASVLVAATSDAGPEGGWAERILASGPLSAPHMVLAEATNILRRLELSGRLGRLEASEAARELVLLDIELLPFEPFAARVWELRDNVTSYDAWYVAIAEALDLPLATLDQPLSRSPGTRCTFLTPTSIRGGGGRGPSPSP